MDPALTDKLNLLQSLPGLHERACNGKAGERAALARAVLLLRGREGADEARLKALTGLPASALESGLNLLASRAEALCWDKESRFWISQAAFAELLAACLARAAELHRKDPLKPAFSRNALWAGWGRNLPPRLIQRVLDAALKQGRLVVEGEGLRLPEHKITLEADQAGLRQKLLQAHQRGGLAPPNVRDVLEELGVSAKEAAPVLRLLCEEGALVRVKDGLYYDGGTLGGILEQVRLWFADHENLDVGGLKEMLGLSRKYLIALLEYMDNTRITVRVGDQRRYRGH